MSDDTVTLLIPFIDDFGATIVIILLVWYALTVAKMQDARARERDAKLFNSLDKLLTILGQCVNSDTDCG